MYLCRDKRDNFKCATDIAVGCGTVYGESILLVHMLIYELLVGRWRFVWDYLLVRPLQLLIDNVVQHYCEMAF